MTHIVQNNNTITHIKHASTEGIYGETGRFAVVFDILCRSISYADKQIDMDNFHFKYRDSLLTNTIIIMKKSLSL